MLTIVVKNYLEIGSSEKKLDETFVIIFFDQIIFGRCNTNVN